MSDIFVIFMIIRPETPSDIAHVYNVTAAAFSTNMEARLVDILRADGDLCISLIAESDGEIIGHIALSPMQAPVRALGLGPVAIRPAFQNREIGSKLIKAALKIARNGRIQVVFLLGHAKYYPRFGFSADLAAPFSSPFAGPNFMAKEPEFGCLANRVGKVDYAPAFSRI